MTACQDCGVKPFGWMGGKHSCLRIGQPTISETGAYAPAVYFTVTEDNIDWLTK